VVRFLSSILFFIVITNGMGQQRIVYEKYVFEKHNQTLPYRLLRPANVESGQKYPLVLFLHGAGERGEDNEAQLKHVKLLGLDNRYRTKYPCFVLAPQCPKGVFWTQHNRDGSLRSAPGAPLQMVIDLLRKIMNTLPIDSSRIYITGVSMGAFATWELLARYPNEFAAAVPVCGGGDTATVGRFQAVPLWAFHGAQDPVVAPSASRSMVEALQRLGAKPRYIEYLNVGHDSWVKAYQEPQLIPWLFEQQRSHP